MKPMIRQASVRWTGETRDGSGTMSTESGALQQARFSSDIPSKKSSRTNPAELIAAAHAGSFSMALADELGTAGFVPDHIVTVATVTLEYLDAGWTMTNINLEVLAQVPGAAQGDFIDASLRAKTGCPISRLLRANVSMNAKLESNAFLVALPQPPKPNGSPPTRNNRGRIRKSKPSPKL